MKKLLYTIALLATLGVCLISEAQDTTIRRAGGASASQITNSILASFDPSQFSTNGGIVRVANGATVTNLVFDRWLHIGGASNVTSGAEVFGITNQAANAGGLQFLVTSTNNTSIKIASSNIVNGNQWFTSWEMDPATPVLTWQLGGTTLGQFDDNGTSDNYLLLGASAKFYWNSGESSYGLGRQGTDGVAINIANSGNISIGGGSTSANTESSTPASQTEFVGSLGYTSRTVGNGSTTLNDADYIVYVVTTGGAATIVLPDIGKRVYIIKDKVGNALVNNITIDPAGATTIDGAATYVININFRSVTVANDGTNWFKLSVSP